jgi:hypothetical protein
MRYVAALILSLTLPLAAQDLYPGFSVVAATGRADFDTNVRIDPEGGTDLSGTRINLERDLGLPEQQDMQRFSLEWRPLQRHELAISHFSASRNAAQQIEREIVFRDETYPVSAFVTSNFDLDYTSATYTFWARRAERSGIGITLGVAQIAVDADITATRPGESVSVSESAETDVPVALAGLQLRGALGRRVQGRVNAAALPRVTINGYSGRALKGDASIEYRATRWLGLGAAYDYFQLDVDIAQGDLQGDIAMKIQGPGVFVRLGF